MLDGWTTSLLAFRGLPRGPVRSGEWITPFCSGCKHLLRKDSPKLWLNLLPSRPHKETLLPPRSPSLHTAGGDITRLRGFSSLRTMTSLVFNDPAKSAQGDKTDGSQDRHQLREKKALRKTSRKKGSKELRGPDGVRGFHYCLHCLEMWAKRRTIVTSKKELQADPAASLMEVRQWPGNPISGFQLPSGFILRCSSVP